MVGNGNLIINKLQNKLKVLFIKSLFHYLFGLCPFPVNTTLMVLNNINKSKSNE